MFVPFYFFHCTKTQFPIFLLMVLFWHLFDQACYAVLQSWVSKKFMTGWWGAYQNPWSLILPYQLHKKGKCTFIGLWDTLTFSVSRSLETGLRSTMQDPHPFFLSVSLVHWMHTSFVLYESLVLIFGGYCLFTVWSSFLWLLHFLSLGGLFNLLMVSSAPYMKDLVLTYLVRHFWHCRILLTCSNLWCNDHVGSCDISGKLLASSWVVSSIKACVVGKYISASLVLAGLGFVTSITFIFFVGIFASSWLGSTVFWLGEWFIKRMPFVKHLYSASKQISSAISSGNIVVWLQLIIF